MQPIINRIYSGMNEKEKKKVDEFILNKDTNGEFINTLKYLSYHKNRFYEDSIYISDKGSGSVLGVVLANVNSEENQLVSHTGTTFSGPILNLKNNYHNCEMVMDMMLDYYENKYKEIDFKITPEIYNNKAMGIVEHILLKHGYQRAMTALVNIVDLFGIDSEDSILAMYDSKRRNEVRKAKRDQLFKIVKKDKVDKGIWEAMNKNLRNKFEVNSTHSYEEICELQRLFPERIVSYTANTKDGEYAAFALVYKFKNVFHTQYLDVNYKFSRGYPNLLLIHYLIKEAVKEKYRVFSFGASTEHNGVIVNEGLFSYKQGFGGGSIILPMYKKLI